MQPRRSHYNQENQDTELHCCLKCPHALSHPILLPHPKPTTDLFSVPIILAFPECFIAGAIEYMPFGLQLPPLSIMYWDWLIFLQGSAVYSSLLLSSIPLCGCLKVCLSIQQLRNSGLFPVWGDYEQMKLLELWTGFGVNIISLPLGKYLGVVLFQRYLWCTEGSLLIK